MSRSRHAHLASTIDSAQPVCEMLAGAPSAGVVLVRAAGGEFRGSAIAVSPWVVMTCAHVVDPSWQYQRDEALRGIAPGLRVFPSRGGGAEVADRVEPKHRGMFDWAALRLRERLNVACTPLVEAVTPAWLESWSGHLEAHGFAHGGVRGAALGLSLCGARWAQRGILQHAQTEGGVPCGMSGGALVVRAGERIAIVGMYYLGGEPSARSTFYGSALLIRLLRRSAVVPRTISTATIDRWRRA